MCTNQIKSCSADTWSEGIQFSPLMQISAISCLAATSMVKYKLRVGGQFLVVCGSDETSSDDELAFFRTLLSCQSGALEKQSCPSCQKQTATSNFLDDLKLGVLSRSIATWRLQCVAKTLQSAFYLNDTLDWLDPNTHNILHSIVCAPVERQSWVGRFSGVLQGRTIFRRHSKTFSRITRRTFKILAARLHRTALCYSYQEYHTQCSMTRIALLNILSQGHRNLCVIHSWKQFPGAWNGHPRKLHLDNWLIIVLVFCNKALNLPNMINPPGSRVMRCSKSGEKAAHWAQI